MSLPRDITIPIPPQVVFEMQVASFTGRNPDVSIKLAELVELIEKHGWNNDAVDLSLVTFMHALFDADRDSK